MQRAQYTDTRANVLRIVQRAADKERRRRRADDDGANTLAGEMDEIELPQMFAY